jgi:MtfA peptidase
MFLFFGVLGFLIIANFDKIKEAFGFAEPSDFFHPGSGAYFKGKFPYYDRLPDDLKKQFLSRVHGFLKEKKFSGRGGLQITDEMKSQIAGAAVQLTFGLDHFTFDYFKQIIIYPDTYTSVITGKKHKGETNAAGVIVLSWKDFVKGYNIPDDKMNLGLHEMAHALELESRLGNKDDFIVSEYYSKWIDVSTHEFNNLRNETPSFLRLYGGTDRLEFFAVCVEHFFEASAEFKKELPELYHHLCLLLNQDPLEPDLKVQTIEN